MQDDKWYKALRRSNNSMANSTSNYTNHQEQTEARPSEQDLSLEDIKLARMLEIYDTKDITINNYKLIGTEADEDEVEEPAEDTTEDTNDDNMFDLGGDDTSFDDFEDDSDSFGSDDDSGSDSKKGDKLSRKDSVKDEYNQSIQIRKILKFPEKFQELRNVVNVNIDIAHAQVHANPRVQELLNRIHEKYKKLLSIIDIYIENIDTKLHEDIFSDYIRYHTIAKALKMQYDALMKE